MGKIVRTESAKRDILAIFEYIAAENQTAAFNWVDHVDSTLRRISRFPLLGERVDHLSVGMRRFCVGNYLLFYMPIEDGIELRRVLHGARKIEDLFS